MQFNYVQCPKHREECGIYITSSVPQIQPLLICKKDYATLDEMYAYVYLHYVARYSVKTVMGHVTILEHPFHQEAYFQWLKEFYTPPSQIPLRAMTMHRNELRPAEIKLHPIVDTISKIADSVIYDALGLNQNKVVGGLEQLCLQRTSVNFILTKKVVTPSGEHPLYVFSTNNVGIPKQIRLLKEFAFDAAQRGPTYAKIQKLVPGALSNLMFVLNTKKYYNTLSFQYSPKMLVNMVKYGTSGGIMNTAIGNMFGVDCKISVVNYGKKLHLFEAAARELHTIINKLATEEEIDEIIENFMPLNITKWKQEIRLLYEKKYSELIFALAKAREFFIPSVTLTLLSELLHKERMERERGRALRIGMTFWHGGAYELALYLNFDNPNLFWVDGDITALDKHITDWQLYLYLASGARYYNWAAMNGSQRKLLKRLYLLLLYHVTNKITLQPGTIWRLIRGVMYSGGKETSHGDSWIMGLIFFLYVQYTSMIYPHAAPFINRCILMGFIAIVLYGDDHIWCAPKVLRGMLGANSFATFLKEFLGMELRDFKEYDKFLSEVNHVTGVMTYSGPKFLKRYFIKNFLGPDSAPVIPFKPFTESLVRLCAVTEEEGILGGILKALGIMWDTMGTNIPAYEAAKAVYDHLVSLTPLTPLQIYTAWCADKTKIAFIKSIVKKIRMTGEEIFESCPTLSDLQLRHFFDPIKCNNHIHNFKMRE